MIAFLKGSLAAIDVDSIVVENNGVGFRVYAPVSTLAKIGNVGDSVVLQTIMIVKEDDLSLYGFLTKEELNMFNMLVTVSGVGPKMAMAILSSTTPAKFGMAIITNDVKTLTQAQGVGNKVAQRIVLELKDKIKKQQKIAADAGIGIDAEDLLDVDDGVFGGAGKLNEAVSALVVLGYNKTEAHKAITLIYDEKMTVEDLITMGLKNLGR